jgi:signal transduction histidine kinase
MTSPLDTDRLSVLVHEVRSPVAALAAIAETAAESAAGDSARADLARLAVAACRAIERVVMDVAVASVRLEPVDLGVLAEDAVAAYLLRGSEVTVERDDDGLVVDGDPVRLRQALDNLVTNALAYGGGEKVTVRATRSGDVVRVAISDAGPGIPAGEQARIFEPGVRLGRGSPGSGIGLALTRAIVDAHGGSVSVESSPGAGATFTIALPTRSPQPDTRASSS